MPSLPTKFLVDPKTGRYIGAFSDFLQPEDVALDREGNPILDESSKPVFVINAAKLFKARDVQDDAVEVPSPPADGRDTWDGSKWVPAQPLKKPLSLDALAQALIAKGVITAADLEEK